MKSLSYSLEQGHPFERLIMIKDRRTRRPRKLTAVRGTMRLRTDPSITFIPSFSISYEGGAKLYISYEDTLQLEAGTWDFDLVGTFRGYEEPLVVGTIEVSASPTITVLGGGVNMLIRYFQNTDYRRDIVWSDADGNPRTITDARMQAVDDQSTVVLDLSFAATPLDESAIGLLDGEKRGYITPVEGGTLQVHISDQNTVAAGSYSYDLFALDSDGDWGRIANGALEVTAPITDPSS